MALRPSFLLSTLYFTICISFVFLPIASASTIFNFTSFSPNNPNITFSGDAFPSGDVLHLTRNQVDGDLIQSSGRAVYSRPINLYNPTRTIEDFITHFEFNISGVDATHFGDGLAFFIAPVGSVLPQNSTGKWLGLFNKTTNNSTSNKLVAVEFDTFQNKEWDPDGNHVGINVNSIESVRTITWNSSIKDGLKGSAWVGYNSTLKNLFVYLSYGQDEYNGVPSLSYNLDLTTILPEDVIMGFSASTGTSTELHKVLSWNLVTYTNDGVQTKPKQNKTTTWVVVSVTTSAILMAGLGYLVFFWRSLRKRKKEGEGLTDMDTSMEDKFVKGTGPRKFAYKELVRATNSFSEDGKLGQGGFGGVYKGVLNEDTMKEIIAVKKISRGSSQGKKEYVSEVTVISRLRHRNLVKLIGWCHEYGEFLLVYEYMPNGSLDSHLFGKKISLDWAVRYKIALGLASALLYLHEEGEQCVVHRDIKSSNVMLDSSFNVKLGDFGLARFVDHELGSQTTMLAGTMGYLAPECVMTGKSSKESDVYSFGVVALEIACGRMPVEPKAEESKKRLVEYVWDLYGKGILIDAVDKRLNGNFNEKQLERLIIVGLWCAHPDHKVRPSIRQAIQVLNLEAPLPSLPSKMPVPTYYAPPMKMCDIYTADEMSQCVKERTRCWCHNCSSSSTMSSRASSTKSLLTTNKAESSDMDLV
ncbi:hypothetical protein AQUCO_01000067v1 [Aquilegia coerulea]|uniref:non-specific serine/threonine protein kinase n=1 Tax=Aquilegia coerulea TaxID=218851 RepID=A0A2G5E8R3_AQUCA|nr:hypothetical protein AQUCO_01000067v1 [Aquilegia coerulea]